MIRLLMTIPVLLLVSVVQAEHPDGIGNNDEVSITVNAISNALEELQTNQAELTKLELRVLLQNKSGLLDDRMAASELYVLARAYFQKGDYAEAARIAESGLDVSPKSFAGSKCHLLLGNLCMAKGEFALAEKQFRVADEAIKVLIAEKPHDELSRMRVILLERVGYCASISDHTAKSAEAYRELVETPELALFIEDERLLNANVELAREATSRNDVKAAAVYYSQVEAIAKSDKVSAEYAIRVLYERVRATWPDVASSDRVQSIETLWNDPRFRNTRGVLDVGDELNFHYFFTVPIRRKQFESVSKELISRIRVYVKMSKSVPKELDSLYGVSLLLAIDSYRAQSNAPLADELVKEFEAAYRGRDLPMSFPKDRPAAQIDRIPYIYHSSTPNHFLQSQQRLLDIRDL